MLDLRLLETFREVAARGSFSAAADALSFTQPAVSQHISRLEKQIGTRLFERDARGVTPTRAGRSLLRHAEALLEAARVAEAEVRAEAGLHVPEVHLGSFSSGAPSLVPMALRELRTAHPDIRPTLAIIEEEPAVDALVTGRLDVLLLHASRLGPVPVRPGMATELLLEDPMHVALPSSHPLARRASIALGELADDPWLMTCATGTCQDARLVHEACAAAGFEPRVHFESDDYGSLLGLTASGMGVTVVPSLATTSVPADVAIRPIDGPVPTRSIHAAWREGTETRPEIEATLHALRIAGRRLALQPVNAAAA